MRIDASTRVIYHNPAIQAARVMATYASTSGGWWDNNGAISGCIGAWQAKGAASLAASYTDLTGNGNDLTAGVAPTYNTASGWTFVSASGDYLNMPALSITGSQNRTVVLRTTLSVNTSGVFVSFGPSPDSNYQSFRLRPTSGALRVEITGAGYTSSLSLSTSTDYVISAKLDGTTLADVTLYVDGSSESATGTSTINTVEGANAIGKNNAAAQILDGTIAAIAVYNVALSDADRGTIETAIAAL